MEFDEIIVKESPGLCRCCLSEGCYKDLGSEYIWMEDTEVYADMLLECFDISITQHNDGPNGPNRLICEVCITRLRDACNFKKQVLDSEKKFIDMVARGEFRSKVPVYQEHMKSERDVNVEGQPAEIADVEYLDEDMGFGDDINDTEEPSVSEDITVSTLPLKAKRGRPKKSVKTEKAKVVKLEEKPRSSKVTKEEPNDRIVAKRRKTDIMRLLSIIIECTTIMPFRWHCNKYLCFYCCSSFVDSSKLKSHTIEEHTEVKLSNILKNVACNSRIKLDISKITCTMCLKPTENLETFLDHVSKDHSVQYNRSVSDCFYSFKLSDDDLRCLDCNQGFRFFGPLLAHVHRHHVKTNIFLCEVCGEGFVSKLNLASHMRSIHSYYNMKVLNKRRIRKRQKFQCSKCPQVFRSRYLKKQHLGLEHDVKCFQFRCDECPKVFLLKCRLVEHKLRVHMKEKYYSCEICGFKVFSKDMLKRHMVKHDDSRPFQCEVCKKTFQRKKTLDLHVRIHTNDRRYVCNECGKAFVQVTSLKLHMRVHHSADNLQNSY